LDDKILHRKSNIEQHEAQGHLGVDSDNNLAVNRKCQTKYEQTKLHITIENKRQSQRELQLLYMGLFKWSNNNLCRQCLSPLKLCVGTPLMARCTRYNIM
jgi:hypothetical protein